MKPDFPVQFLHQVGGNVPDSLSNSAEGHAPNLFDLRFAVVVKFSPLMGQQQLKVIDPLGVGGQGDDRQHHVLRVGRVIGDNHSGTNVIGFVFSGRAEIYEVNIASANYT